MLERKDLVPADRSVSSPWVRVLVGAELHLCLLLVGSREQGDIRTVSKKHLGLQSVSPLLTNS